MERARPAVRALEEGFPRYFSDTISQVQRSVACAPPTPQCAYVTSSRLADKGYGGASPSFAVAAIFTTPVASSCSCRDQEYVTAYAAPFFYRSYRGIARFDLAHQIAWSGSLG